MELTPLTPTPGPRLIELPLASLALLRAATTELAPLLARLDAKDDVNKITETFFTFGLGIAAGLAALGILAGWLMIATAHGSQTRGEHGRSAIIIGLVGLVGAALTKGLIEIVKAVFPQLR